MRARNDIYEEEAAKAARTGASQPAVRAAAEIARAFDLDAASLVAYMIDDQFRRILADPSRPLVDREWMPLFDAVPREDVVEMVLKAQIPAGVDEATSRASRAAAIRIANEYFELLTQSHRVFSPSPKEAIGDFLSVVPGRIAEYFSRSTAHARVADVETAMREIQAHRRALGMPPLDAHAAGWTEDDVLLEADRLRRLSNPMQDLKHRLI